MNTAKRWSHGAGARGTNRVRVFEERSGALYVEVWERDATSGELRRVRTPLGHRDRERAIQQVEQMAARIAAGPMIGAGEITLGSLFDIYVAEVTPRKGKGKQDHDRRAARMFLEFWGRSRAAASLNLRDWEQFIDARRAGRVGPSGRRVRDRQIEYDLSWLRAVFHWATLAGESGQRLLAQNPLDGCKLPRERNPVRSALTEAQYQALLRAARQLDWRLALALVLANETGHRLSAIRHLRWSDVDLERGVIRWRAETDKTRFEHVTPISPALHAALSVARKQSATIGDTWLIPSSRKADQPCPKGTLDKAFARAAEVAGVELPPRARWHGLRRKFATELKHVPLKDLCHLGGWKDAKTILTCYQQPDEDVMRRALLDRRPFGQSSERVSSIGGRSIDETHNARVDLGS
jgi:integrase